MSEKKRIVHVSAGFQCDRIIVCESLQDVMIHVDAELENTDVKDLDVGDSITITIAEATQEELDKLVEFDGC